MDKARARGEDVKRCRCGERQRGKATVGGSLSLDGPRCRGLMLHLFPLFLFLEDVLGSLISLSIHAADLGTVKAQEILSSVSPF